MSKGNLQINNKREQIKYKKVLVIGPNTDMVVHGGIVTHMKLLALLSGNRHFEFYLEFFTIGTKVFVGEKSTINKIFSEFVQYIYLLAQNECKIVHINSSMINKSILKNLVILIFAKFFLKKCIFQFHGGEPADISKLFKFYLRLIVNLSDKVLVLTDDQIKIKQYLKEVKRGKIEKIPNFVDTNYSISEKDINLKRLNFLFVGRIIREKGVYEIVEAVKKLSKEDFIFSISIMGDGPELENLKKLVKNLDLDRYFVFHGFVKNDGIKRNIYLASHLMVLPSYKEGFPYAILEAMSYKMPIISTKVGAISDMVEHDVNGFLIPERSVSPLVEKMKFFILNTKEIESMGSNSLNLVNSKFSLEVMRVRFTSVYNF